MKVTNPVTIVPIDPKKSPCTVMVTTDLTKRMGIKLQEDTMIITFYEIIGSETTQISRVLSYADWEKFCVPSPFHDTSVI